jgi:hypothetical protein
VYADSSGFIFRPVVKQTVTASTGIAYNMTTASTALLFGNVPGDIQSLIALKMPIFPDSVGQIMTDTLFLHMRYAYEYGDPNNQTIDFSVYALDDNSINDNTTSISLANGKIVGTYATTLRLDTLRDAVIPLDTTIMNPWLRTASLALVIVPNAAMSTIRNYASGENSDNSAYVPTLKLFTKRSATDTSTIFANSVGSFVIKDFYVTKENFTSVPAGEFIVRASYSERERIVINIKHIRDQLGLNPYVTINSALMQIHSDPKYHTSSSYPLDTTGPSLGALGSAFTVDSGHAFIAYGARSLSGDTNLYSFQIRDSIESALRNGEDSLVLDLRGGFAFRSVAGATVDVDDYNINRWVFYGMDCADLTKRPQLVITYSYLR